MDNVSEGGLPFDDKGASENSYLLTFAILCWINAVTNQLDHAS